MSNLSDDIERYIKAFLVQSDEIELKRSEIASQFDCVPSQINYVINTRFTVPKGYVVVSKRGGSGYIRITKIQLRDNAKKIDLLAQQIESEMTINDTKKYLIDLFQQGFMTRREIQLLSLVLNSPAIDQDTNGNNWRSDMLAQLTEHLKYYWE
ncbi:CtsR family transcriptional regulator [Bavariicoccus seileri]|uniref:CtsR family transcriptional regulator n=1 Tax=Bavariicoccus seileri TaxID=549685 RepID=UPI003F9335EB